MGKKRKSEATRLDEVDQTMYSAFCGAANSLSQLYSQAMHQQRASFHAGERHALEKLYAWMLRQQEIGARLMPGDVFAYVQNEFNYGAEEPPPQQQPHGTMQSTTHSANPMFSNASGPAAIGQQGLPLPRALFTRDPNPPSSNDTSMDMHMHADSPGHDSPY
ncbi:uncharacterized protein LOC127258106 [Andrographis paniculata]|uniref:uncharacterized protein LOC127258106 n=1 Tax=Andrographis paniculata TaxID=175694 RepID=UPI0021E76417|nr:uncharacterized protein LOC127258106 [Andrographis paniculata]